MKMLALETSAVSDFDSQVILNRITRNQQHKLAQAARIRIVPNGGLRQLADVWFEKYEEKVALFASGSFNDIEIVFAEVQ